MPTFSTSNTSVLIWEILSLCGKTSYSYLSASKTTNTPWQKEKTSGSKILYTHNIINRNNSMSLSLSHYHTVWTYRLPSILVKKLQRSVVMLRTTNCCVTAEKLHKRKQNLYLLYIYESCSHLILLQLPFNTLLDLHYSSDDTHPHSIIISIISLLISEADCPRPAQFRPLEQNGRTVPSGESSGRANNNARG